MRYKVTKLYDSPDAPKGTVYYILRESSFLGKRRYEYIKEGTTEICYQAVGGVFDDPQWFKKEIDYENLSNLKCPKCNETRGTFFSTSYYCRDIDADEYGTQFAIGFECVCGHKRVLYGTRYGTQKLEKELN